MGFSDQLLSALGRIVRDGLRAADRGQRRTPRPRVAPGEGSPKTGRADRPGGGAPALSTVYPGDFRGMPRVSYDPHPGTLPDPGEVVWTWVPYEEDHSQGKDRPVVLVGRDGDWLLALPLTSEDHDVDAAQEASEGRYWLDVGSGPWDSRGRPSEVRLNRVVRVDPRNVRRVSARLPKPTFDAVAAGMRRYLR